MGSHGDAPTKIAILGRSGGGHIGPPRERRTYSLITRHYDRISRKKLYLRVRNTLSFILLQGHQGRVRNASREVFL